MNKIRRKEIYAVIKKLENLLKEKDIDRIFEQLFDIIEDIDFIFFDEESSMDNIPENLRNGLSYFEAEERRDNLKEALEILNDIEDDDERDSVIKAINEAVEYLNNSIC